MRSIPISLKRYYVVEDVNRAAEGFSQTWWPHLLRLKMKTLVDSQEFKDIIGDATTAGSVASYMSTYNREKTINDQIVAQAGGGRSKIRIQLQTVLRGSHRREGQHQDGQRERH
jgi:hypothetical protein